MTEELTIQYKQEGITPFWKKLPFFFLFPFRIGPLIFMLCIVGASAVAGLAFGGIGFVLKGSLVYLGLRYAFNVLELFAKGRFEGHSVDHTLWGPEKRPAKLGLVIALFIFAAISVGNSVLESRVAKNVGVQDRLVERYKTVHAQELEALRQQQEAWDKRVALAKAASERAASHPPSEDGDEADDSGSATMDSSFAFGGRPEAAPSREQMVQETKPTFSDPLWFKLQPAWYWMLVVLLSLVLPSAAIVIALEDKFFKALNPALVVYFIRSIGSAYFALWAFFL